METYRRIDALRGNEPRSAWLQRVVEREAAHRERAQLAEELRSDYTPRVCRETLAINNEFPIDEA